MGRERLCAEPSKAAARAPKAGSRRQAQGALKALTAPAAGEERRAWGVPGRSSPPRPLRAPVTEAALGDVSSKKPRARPDCSPLPPSPRAPAGAFIPGEASSGRIPSSPPCPLLPSRERLGRRDRPRREPAPPARRQGAVALPGGGRAAAGRLPPRLTPCLACSSASRCCRKASSSSSAMAAGRSRSRSARAVLRLRHRARRY